MGLFDFLKPTRPPAVTYRLTWFELQIAPFAYRLAILPEQPILIGLQGDAGEKGVTLLIRYDNAPQIFESTVEKIAALVAKHRILSLVPRDPQLAFTSGMDRSSVHLRLAYADNSRWAGVYEIEKLPAEVAGFVAETKTLARQIMKEMPHQTIDAETADRYLAPEKNAAQKDAAQVIVRIRITRAGTIAVNQQETSLAALGPVLDELKNKNGAVWYSRETPTRDLDDSAMKTVRAVLDAVMSRKLPIRLLDDEV